MNQAELLKPFPGLPAGTLGDIVGRLKPSGPVNVQWPGYGMPIPMRRHEIRIIEMMGWDSVYVNNEED